MKIQLKEIASTGPRSRERGRIFHVGSVEPSMSLQRGHAHVSAEGQSLNGDFPSRLELQRGHAHVSAEGTFFGFFQPFHFASTGPRSRERGGFANRNKATSIATGFK